MYVKGHHLYSHSKSDPLVRTSPSSQNLEILPIVPKWAEWYQFKISVFIHLRLTGPGGIENLAIASIWQFLPLNGPTKSVQLPMDLAELQRCCRRLWRPSTNQTIPLPSISNVKNYERTRQHPPQSYTYVRRVSMEKKRNVEPNLVKQMSRKWELFGLNSAHVHRRSISRQ